MKRFINQETVMLIVLSLVVLVVMFGATVAWFVGATPAGIENMDLQADDKGELYVYVKTEQQDDSSGTESGTESGQDDVKQDSERDSEGFVALNKIGTGDNVSYKIDMHLVDQNNILKKTFAPGAYGKVVFKIMSKTSIIKGYKIRITPGIKAADGLGNTALELSEEDLLGLVKSHIKFYETFDNPEYNDVIPYDKECMYDNGTEHTDGLEGTIEEGETKYVTLYWYWPYEYTDIPASLHIDDVSGKFYEEFKKYAGKTDKECIEEYDWDDTYIGNFVENLTFHFDVETVR